MSFVSVRNGVSVPRDQVPVLELSALQSVLGQLRQAHLRLGALFGVEEEDGLSVVAVVIGDGEGQIFVTSARLKDRIWPSLAEQCPEIQLFEREVCEQHGVRLLGHPSPHPVRFWPSGSGGDPGTVGVFEHYRVHGDEVHEVAVGPVHAGVIEPGHFRFQCHGEQVLFLEISLGYQHRGVERALLGGPHRRSLAQIQTVAGDTTVAHTTAYASLLEGLSGSQVSARAHAIRGIALELERLANHVGDLGALANDVGFLPTAAFSGRLRGDLLNTTALLCGNRFSRGLIRVGGVGMDLEPERARELASRLTETQSDVENAIQLLWETPSVLARFEGTGAITTEQAGQLGLVGLAARAAGLERDVRQDFPSGIFRVAQIPVSVAWTGDVFARAYLRWLEIQRSAAFVRERLSDLPKGALCDVPRPLAADRLAVSLCEGWRGEVCHVALTDSHGRFLRYKIVDPSFHNWAGLALALRGQEISDFPLCNKSFDLSYCGFDL